MLKRLAKVPARPRSAGGTPRCGRGRARRRSGGSPCPTSRRHRRRRSASRSRCRRWRRASCPSRRAPPAPRYARARARRRRRAQARSSCSSRARLRRELPRLDRKRPHQRRHGGGVLARRGAVAHAPDDALQDRGQAEEIVGEIDRQMRPRVEAGARDVSVDIVRARRDAERARDRGRRACRCRRRSPTAACPTASGDRRDRRADRRAWTAPSRAPPAIVGCDGDRMMLSRR